MIGQIPSDQISLIETDVRTAYREMYQKTLNWPHFHQVWKELTEEYEGGILASYNEHEIEGCLGYLQDQNMFTGEYECTVAFTYVRPQYRGLHIYRDLLITLEEAMPLNIEIYPYSHQENKFLMRRGYHPELTIYRKECPA